uniref:BRICHOS domain-containing protein n=1 Tax=Salvator merianae TaxID=96440 RepID=A0A8D0CBR5_SALMN
MTIQGSKQHLSMSRKERMATFHVGTANSSATLVYDYSNLLIGYRSWPGGSCYILRMSKENIQSLDAAIRVFQHIKEPKHLVALLKKGKEEVEGLPVPLVDRSTLGTTINILCSSVPIYWV